MKHLITTACMVFLAAVSCNKNSLTPKTEGPVEVVFSADDSFSAQVTTKTSAVTSLETSGFYASATKGTSGSETQMWNNATFTYSSTDQKYKGDKYWPATSTQMHFYASNQSLTFAAGGCTISAANTTDVVCAYVESPTWKQEVTPLTFNHVFSRIGKCSISAPAGYTGSGLTVKITPKTSGTYNLRTATWSGVTTATSATTLATQFNSNNNVDLYLVPGTYEISATYTLSKGGDGGYSETISKKASVTLPAGQISNISAILPAGNAQEIVFTVTVTAWTTQSLSATFQ